MPLILILVAILEKDIANHHKKRESLKQKPIVSMKLLGHFASWKERLSIQVRLDFKFSLLWIVILSTVR